MTTIELKPVGVLAKAATLIAQGQGANSVSDFIAAIKSPDDAVRGPAWQGAAAAGPAAIKPLATVITDPNFEVARSAKRALWKIVRHTGRPGAASEAKATIAELVPLLKSAAASVRREVLWMLSEIGGDDVISPMAALLTDPEAREDARCALMRFSGGKATAAFQSVFSGAPEEFKCALAESLRQRGVKVEGYPSQKLVPNRKTTVGMA
jgi:HEAT repeat protein